jgi:hypothetical protein
MVTGGPERRQTGTHYTPKSLTEKIVTETLEPIVYVGPSEGRRLEAARTGRTPRPQDLRHGHGIGGVPGPSLSVAE